MPAGVEPLAEHVIADRDGRQLGVCEWGDPEGAPVVWLHGTPGSRLLRHVGDGYVENRLRVVTYDRPGYGLSTRVPGRVVSDTADDVAVIADALGLDRFGVAGVSGGGAPALAVAALLPSAVSRCAAIVTSAPFTAEGLDFYAGMDEECRLGWERQVEGEEALHRDYQEMLDLVDAGMPGEQLSDAEREMFKDTVREAIRQGPAGYVDDNLSQVRSWGFAVEDVRVPTRIMLARDDTSVPAAHGEWFLEHLPQGELIWADGGHFGPRDEPEMALMAWVGHGAGETSG